MNQSSKTALGGMITALSVVILMPTALEIFVYALPAFAGMLVMFSVIELGKKWAAGIYTASALVSVLLVPNKEAAILYALFFGYYPILKAIFESKLPKILEYIAKFAVFNVSMILSYALLIKVLGMPFAQIMGLDGSNGFYRKFAAPVMLILGNIVFIVFDVALTKIFTLYIKLWQKKIRKMFHFK